MDRFEIDEKTIETLKLILKRDGYNFREINPQKEEGGVFGIDENGNKIRITDSLGHSGLPVTKRGRLSRIKW